MGVNWYNGQSELKKTHGLPSFWNDPKNLNVNKNT